MEYKASKRFAVPSTTTDQRRGKEALANALKRLKRTYPEVYANINNLNFREDLKKDFAAEIEALGGRLTPETQEEAETLEEEIYELGETKLKDLRQVIKAPGRLTEITRQAIPPLNSEPPPPRGKRGSYLTTFTKRVLLFEFVVERVVRLNPLLEFTFDTEGKRIPWGLLAAEWKRLYPDASQSKETLRRKYYRARKDATVRMWHARQLLQDFSSACQQHEELKHILAGKGAPEHPPAKYKEMNFAALIRGERGLYLRNRSATRTDLLNHHLSISASLAARRPPTTYAEYRDYIREGEKLLEPLRPMRFFTDAFPPKHSKGTQAAKAPPPSPDEAWRKSMRRGIQRRRAELATKRSAQTSPPTPQSIGRTKAKASRRPR